MVEKAANEGSTVSTPPTLSNPEPVKSVKRSEFNQRLVTAKLVEVAFVVVPADALRFTKYDVEDAKSPDCAQIGDDVAAEMTP